MINFNDSESSSSISERYVFSTISMMSLVKHEVNKILQKLPVSGSREEIVDFIRKSLEDSDDKLRHVVLHDTNDELEITIKDITEDQDKATIIIESIENLEHRIRKLERCIKFLLKNVPKLKLLQTKKLKLNINDIKNKLNSLTKIYSHIKRESLKSSPVTNEDKEITFNIYDQLFYTEREHTLNLLNYKKSMESLELNRFPKWNPYVKPTYEEVFPQEGNIKKLSMFLTL